MYSTSNLWKQAMLNMPYTYIAQSHLSINILNIYICISKNNSNSLTVCVCCIAMPVYHSFIQWVAAIFLYFLFYSLFFFNIENQLRYFPLKIISLKNILTKILIIVICYLLFKEIKQKLLKKVHCSLNFSVRQRFDKVILTWYGIKRSCLILHTLLQK